MNDIETHSAPLKKKLDDDSVNLQKKRDANSLDLQKKHDDDSVNLLLEKAHALDSNDCKQQDERESLMQEAIALRPTSPQLWLELAQIQQGCGRDDQIAVSSFRKAISLNASSSNRNPQIDGKALSSIGWIALNTLDFKTVQEDFESAAIADPADAAQYYIDLSEELDWRGYNAQNTKGRWNASKQKEKDALILAAANKAVSISPDSAEAHYALGVGLGVVYGNNPRTDSSRNLGSVWNWIRAIGIVKSLIENLNKY